MLSLFEPSIYGLAYIRKEANADTGGLADLDDLLISPLEDVQGLLKATALGIIDMDIAVLT